MEKKHVFIHCEGCCCQAKYCARSFELYKVVPKKEQIEWLHEYCPHFIEYNLDMSAEHPIKDDDIVRHSSEKERIKDKEP